MKDYEFNDLRISTQSSRYDFADASVWPEAEKKIKECIYDGSLMQLSCNYHEDAMSMDVFSEDGKSFITIYDTYGQKSCSYINPLLKKDSGIVDIAGYESSKRILCEDKNVLYKNITFFLKYGQPDSQEEWEWSE